MRNAVQVERDLTTAVAAAAATARVLTNEHMQQNFQQTLTVKKKNNWPLNMTLLDWNISNGKIRTCYARKGMLLYVEAILTECIM